MQRTRICRLSSFLSAPTSVVFPPLQSPTIIYESNHLLVVNKPSGWHSIPNSNNNTGDDTVKCLLTYLQRQKLGGGSTGTFLKPIHRLDQPCTGILLLAKTTKAASRIQSAWATGKAIQKTYLAIVTLDTSTKPLWKGKDPNSDETLSLSATVHPPRRRHGQQQSPSSNKGWSVRVVLPHQQNDGDTTALNQQQGGRPVQLQVQPLVFHDTVALLRITTHHGARHVVRSVLAAYGMPILGDFRYGHHHHHWNEEKSVALHAERLIVNTSIASTLLMNMLPTNHQTILYAKPPIRWYSMFPQLQET